MLEFIPSDRRERLWRMAERFVANAEKLRVLCTYVGAGSYFVTVTRGAK